MLIIISGREKKRDGRESMREKGSTNLASKRRVRRPSPASPASFVHPFIYIG